MASKHTSVKVKEEDVMEVVAVENINPVISLLSSSTSSTIETPSRRTTPNLGNQIIKRESPIITESGFFTKKIFACNSCSAVLKNYYFLKKHQLVCKKREDSKQQKTPRKRKFQEALAINFQ
jgi:hypothetical protein